MKKLNIFLLIFLLSFLKVNAYEPLECDSNQLFNQYSCHECFDGGSKNQGDTISFLDDVWINNSDTSKIMFENEQTMPVMNTFNESIVGKIGDENNFWEFPEEIKNLYNDDLGGFVLEPNNNVKWIESGLGNGYIFEDLGQGGDISLLYFDILSHNIINNEVVRNDMSHRECVLYTSGSQGNNNYEEIIEDDIIYNDEEIIENDIVYNDEDETSELDNNDEKDEDFYEPKLEDVTKVQAGAGHYILLILLSTFLTAGFYFIHRKK